MLAHGGGLGAAPAKDVSMRPLAASADALLVVAAGVLLLFAVRAGGDSTSPAALPLTVADRASGWRAPGVGVPVTGFAAAHESVVLRANGRVVAGTTSGRLGRYRFRFAALTPGRYRLVVAAGERSRPAGTVVVRPVVLAAVGDITFGEQVGPAILARGARYPWQDVASTLRAADVTIGNLETSVSTRGIAAAKEYTFRGPPHALEPMHDFAGFDVLTLANNHAVDYGRDALVDTLAHVRTAGIRPIGAGWNSVAARRPAILERGGLRIAFLGYSDVNPLGFIATAYAAGTAAADTAAISADVRAARRRADVVVCFFHWGTELHTQPDSRQQTFARACLAAGAKVVLGAHPHVLGSVARPTSRSIVAWTLGNFVFPSSGQTARSAILRVSLDVNGVDSYRLVPVRIDGFRPRPDGR
jgi:poly-gamma-glutamate capsule biosynthesis protein CapA/YwtB (metallophosphatase superfamily)